LISKRAYLNKFRSFEGTIEGIERIETMQLSDASGCESATFADRMEIKARQFNE
jgi:hypothetical protein